MKEQILPPLPIVGRLKLGSRDEKTLCSITVADGPSDKNLDPFFKECFEKLSLYFSGKTTELDIKVDMSLLSPFQKNVLKVMKKIPYGKVATYKDIAVKLDSKAYQAIGNACGRNPFMLIYPCHRVLGTNNIGGFAHGVPMKKALLKLEGVAGK